MKLVQISDSHVSSLGGTTSYNLRLLVEFVNRELRPDLVVSTGDISILSPDSPEDRAAARELYRLFEAPVVAIPGNHDVGEPGAQPWMGIGVTSDRVNAFVESFGSDRFARLDEAGWAIIGINSEVLSSGLPEEDAQWRWLEEVVADARGRNVALFLHKPLWSPLPGYSEHALAIGESDCDRLLDVLGGTSLRVVGSGHLHCYRSAFEGDVLTVWAPSNAFVVRSKDFAFGLSQLGVVEYRIDGEEVEAYFRSIPDLDEHEPFAMPEFARAMSEIEAASPARS